MLPSMVPSLIPRCRCYYSGHILVEVGIGIIKGVGLWWQRDVFLLVSLKVTTPSSALHLRWTLLQ